MGHPKHLSWHLANTLHMWLHGSPSSSSALPPGWNLSTRGGSAPNPADPAIPNPIPLDPLTHRMLESPSIDRRQESIRAGFSRLADDNQMIESSPKPEGEVVIKEEQPEDLSVVNEKDVSIIDPAND